MGAQAPQGFPAISEEDIRWVAELLKLRDLDAHRRDFLMHMDTVDVSACPGSGKTTLLVAKLALLARHWTWRTRGLCVLSHTNVAREEIESRLGATEIGQRLLAYPHFIGTIHGFLSHFIVQPFLLSRGMAFQAFDDDLVARIRERSLPRKEAAGLLFYLSKWGKELGKLRIKNLEFDLEEFPCQPSAPSYQNAQLAVRMAAEQGFFCYDDIFPLAEAALDEIPSLAIILRRRFPFVLLDEMQDTDTRQGDLLNRVFPRDRADLSVQRVGDVNQAIFHGHLEREPSFPDAARSIPIADSFRFGPTIALAASPLAVAPVDGGLQGRRTGAFPAPVIFLFPGDQPKCVLAAFGDVVLETFSDDALDQGAVVAVAAVHKEKEASGPDKKPCTLRDYWPSYQVAHAWKDVQPPTLPEYFLRARRRAQSEGTYHRAVNDVAFGMLQALRLVNGQRFFSPRGSHHRRVLELLSEGHAREYQKLLAHLLVQEFPLDAKFWKVHQPSFEAWVRIMAQEEILGFAGLEFLSWPKEPSVTALAHASPSDPMNTYRHARKGRQVDIRLNSIHGVKGETHLATLVLEVHKDHWFHLAHQLDDLCGKPRPKKKRSPDAEAHARLAYVAMTRPTHLLALALRASDVGEAPAREERIRDLESRGWRIVDLTSPAPIPEVSLEEEVPCLP